MAGEQFSLVNEELAPFRSQGLNMCLKERQQPLKSLW